MYDSGALRRAISRPRAVPDAGIPLQPPRIALLEPGERTTVPAAAPRRVFSLAMNLDRPMSRPPFLPAGANRLRPLVRGISARVRERQLSARGKLLVGALLLATVPLLVASFILPRRVQSTLMTLGEARLTQSANNLAAFTQQNLQLQLENVRALAAVRSFREAIFRHNAASLDAPALAAVNRELHDIVGGMSTELQGAFLCGRDGISFAGVLQSGEIEPYVHLDVRDRAYFADAIRTLQPAISDPLRSKIAGVPVVALVAPVLDANGEFAGIVVLSIKIQHLSELIAGRKIGAAGYPFAIDQHGILVAHPDPARFFTDVLLRVARAERLLGRMRAGERGIEPYLSSTGAHKLAAFAPVPICRWSIAASIEVAEFEAPALRIRAIIYALIGACVVIAIVVAAAFSVGVERLNLALAEARASEARFKLFASVAGGAVWDWNLETDELWWNDGLVATFASNPRRLANYSALRERIPADQRDLVSTGLRNCVDGGAWSGEHAFQRDDGTSAYVLHRATAVRDAAGKPIRIIGGMTDISGRRSIERKLAEQAALLDQTRDGILVQDLDHAIRFWNSGAEKLYGWTAAEATGRRPDELLQIDPDAFAAAARAVIHDDQWFGRLRKKNKSGAILTLECRWTLLRDEHDRPKSILSIDTDITERLLMEEKFLRAQRLESIGTLAGGIAHDLNNLLAPIVMGVDLLRLNELSADQARILGHVEQSARRGTSLVKQVLSFARGVEGTRVAVHVGYVVREVEAMIHSTFPKNITLRTAIPKDLGLVHADPTQLNQVLLNLCVNARDAMPVGGTLSIRASNIELDETFARLHRDLSPGPHLLLEVADTGTGIAPEVLEKMFEPFFTTKAPGKGTGLGLSTVIGIVRSHHGAVNVHSEPGRGSVFKIFLPVAAAAAERPVAAPAAPPPSGHGELILLVDDEPAILSVSKQTLEFFGYRVLLATDGVHAFAQYHRHRAEIALVVTDMMMPLMDGFALTSALRRIDPAIAVVGASGLNDHNDQLKPVEAGIKHFLCKPYTAATLVGIVHTALHERGSSRPAT